MRFQTDRSKRRASSTRIDCPWDTIAMVPTASVAIVVHATREFDGDATAAQGIDRHIVDAFKMLIAKGLKPL